MGCILRWEFYPCALLVSVASAPACPSFLSWFGPLLCEFFHLFQERCPQFSQVSFHFPLGVLSSDMSTTSFCFNGISSLVHFWRTVKLGKYSRNQQNQKWIWSRCWYLKCSERETSAFFGGASGGFPKSLPTAYRAGVMIRPSGMSFSVKTVIISV